MPECPPVRDLAEAQNLLDAAIAIRAQNKNFPWDVGLGIENLQHDVMVKLTLSPMFHNPIAAIFMAKELKQMGQFRAVGQEGEIHANEGSMVTSCPRTPCARIWSTSISGWWITA